jgi:hypothetical protein
MARTIVDLAVPFSPRIKTPKMLGLMAFRVRANFNRSCLTMAAKGYICLLSTVCIGSISLMDGLLKFTIMPRIRPSKWF